MPTFYNNSENNSRKYIFFGLGLVVVILLIGLIFWMNMRYLSQAKTPVTQPTTQIAPTLIRQKVKPEDTIKNEEIQRASFENVGYTTPVFFLPNGKIVSVNKNFKLNINNQEIKDSPSLVPKSVYNASGSLIINEESTSTFYDSITGKFSRFAQGVMEVVPAEDGFHYLDLNANTLSLKKSKTILDIGKNFTILGNIRFSTPFAMYQMFWLNNKPVIILYADNSRQGKVEIWSFKNNNNLELFSSIKNLQSFVVGKNKLLLTQTLEKNNTGRLYQTAVYDFSGAGGSEKVLDLDSKLSNIGAYGNLLASRCNFLDSNKIYCLVKQSRVASVSEVNKDLIVLVDSTSNNVQNMFPNTTFSASKIYVDNQNIVYIVGQSDNKLYRVG